MFDRGGYKYHGRVEALAECGPRGGIEVLTLCRNRFYEKLWRCAGHIEVSANNLKDQVVSIQRVTKVVKGGKNLSFSALVVVGDQHGHAGFGMGKAREVPMAIRKAIEQAKKNLIRLNLKGTSIPHQVIGHYGSGQVLLKPASEGTGIIAGGPVRAVMEVAGISQRADEIDRHLEPAQRHQGHLRRAACG